MPCDYDCAAGLPRRHRYAENPDVAANTLAAADRLRDAGAVVTEVSLPWKLADIMRAARIHFGMIFGPSIGPLFTEHADELTSYARAFVEESNEIVKEDYYQGLELEAALYAPLLFAFTPLSSRAQTTPSGATAPASPTTSNSPAAWRNVFTLILPYSREAIS